MPALRQGLGGTAILAVSLGAPAIAQTCIWSEHAAPPQNASMAVYHTRLQRVIFVDTYWSVETRIWTWNGAQWKLISSLIGPPRRRESAIAYDSARDRLVLCGGAEWPSYPTVHLNDTWEWDGAAWVQVASVSPPGRRSHSMVYDESRGKTVLFGGLSNTAYLGDTWEWDGHAWTVVASTGPSGRESPCFAYDSVRKRSILYAGHNGTQGDIADLWEWDGVAWTQRFGNIPGPRGLWMVFDPNRARMIVGRQNSLSQSGPFSTWEFDTQSAQWTQTDPGTAPYGPAAFDRVRSQAVLQTMEYDGTGALTWLAVIQQPYSNSYYVNAAMTLHVQVVGSSPIFQWLRNGQPLVNGNGTSGVTTDTLTIDRLTFADAGAYAARITNACAVITSNTANISVTPCYPNCDGSTNPPILNALDFSCFLNKFAMFDTYANCDTSNPPPWLNALDFGCFLAKFAAGCP